MISELIAGRFMPKMLGQLAQRATSLGSAAYSQVEQEGLELTRAGRRFEIGVASGVTGIAPVAALPTTAAQWLLYNTDANKSVVLDWLGVLLVSGTAAAGQVLLAGSVAQGSLPATVPSANVTGVKPIPSNSGANKSPSSLVIVSGQTLAAAPFNGWRSIASNGSANTAVLSVAAENRDLRGKLIIPPKEGLALVVLSGAGTTPLFAPQGSWTEIELDLE